MSWFLQISREILLVVRYCHYHLLGDVAREEWWFYGKIWNTFLGPDTLCSTYAKVWTCGQGSCAGYLWAQLVSVSPILPGWTPCSHPGHCSGGSWLVSWLQNARQESHHLFIQMIKKSASKFTSKYYAIWQCLIPLQEQLVKPELFLSQRKLGYIRCK